MNSAWTRFTLSDLQLERWRGASYLYKLVGALAHWRGGSWLLQYSEVIGALLIAIVIGLAPFVNNNLTGFLLLASGIYWLIVTLSDDGSPGVTPIHLLVFVYWCIASLATAFSPVKSAAFLDWRTLTVYLVLFALAARVLRGERILSWTIAVFLLTALIVSTYGVQQQVMGVEQLATWNDPTSVMAGKTRVYSYLGNPNLLAGYLLPAIAFSVGALIVWPGWIQKSLAATMLIVNSCCLYFTDSRGSWIGLSGLIVVLLLLLRYWYADYLPPFWRKWLLPIVFGILLGLITLALLLIEPFRVRFFSIFAGRGDSSNNFRINVWNAVLKMIQDRPLLGIGPGHNAFNKIYPLYMQARFSALSAYSILLEITVEMGIFGLLSFLWLVIVAFNTGCRQLSSFRLQRKPQGVWLIVAIAAMTGLLVHGFVDTVWYRPEINTLWWIILGTIASQCRTPSQFNRINNV